ncbi:MAG: glycosyltransferase family 39 protein [Deltaproteobacteria bacterium]|nr:glycosyltransferase family 39 protein [Deltaproteobacteria bacterium]
MTDAVAPPPPASAPGASAASPRVGEAGIALALFVGTALLVGLTSESVGFTRDEGYYFKAAEDYFGWFREWAAAWGRGDLGAPFSRAVIDRYWSYNHEHPVLMKALFGLSWGVLKEQWGLFSLHSTAFRFPAFLAAGLSVAFTYLLAREFLRRSTSVVAALLWLSMPHAFWHMHLACFDVPVCAAHTWLVLTYVRGRHSWRGALVVGIAFGLGAAIKHNVLIVPGVLLIHWVMAEGSRVRRDGAFLILPPVPLAFLSMAVLGPLVFLAHWPYLWPDIAARYGWYLGFHLNHEHYPILYFGELLTRPPFPHAFVYVMTAVTAPLALCVLMVLGTGMATYAGLRLTWRRYAGRPADEVTRVGLTSRHGDPTGWGALLLLGNAAFPFALWIPDTTPIFGGTKHWMNAMPFLCILAAWALEEALQRARSAWQRAAAVPWARAWGLAAALTVLPGFIMSARVHPYGLSSYNELVGFARGAANVGFQRTFWGHEPRAVLPAINARTRERGSIHFGDTNYDDWRMYVRDALLRKDMGFSNTVAGAAVASVQPQGEFKDQWMDVVNSWATTRPHAVVHVDGVPLLTVTFAP